MEKKKQENIENDNPESLKIWKYVIASILLHLSVICAGAIDFSSGSRITELKKSSLNVSIVDSAPEKKATDKSKFSKKTGKNINIADKKKEKEKKEKIEDKKPLVPQEKKRLPRKVIDLEGKKKKKSLDKKTENKYSNVKNTVKEFKEEIVNSDKNKFENIAKDIESFRKDIEKETKGSDKDHGLLSGISEGAELADKIDRYRYKIAFEVEKKWALPSELINNQDNLETFIVFSVLKDGSIKNIWFDKKSGNTYFDESVYRAVQKAAPLPPHPEGIEENSVFVGLRFTPEGLK